MNEDRIVTASAYVLFQGLFLFMVGPTRSGDRLAVVRLGGHREPGESGPACAVREVLEEASVRITLPPPPATYWAEEAESGFRLIQGPSPLGAQAVAPLVISRHRGGPSLSVTYLATTDEEPRPAAEARGLLLLDPAAVHRLTSERVTLGQYLRDGGGAILREEFDPDLPLEPFAQLRMLPRLLALHPELVKR